MLIREVEEKNIYGLLLLYTQLHGNSIPENPLNSRKSCFVKIGHACSASVKIIIGR